MLLLLAACASPFPCPTDQRLDADGVCHDVPKPPGAGDSDDSGTGDSGDTDTGDPDTGDTDPPVDDGWPTRFVAPYVDATAYPTVRLARIAPDSGVLRYTLGFVVAASASECRATWGTYYDLETGPSAWEGGAEYTLYEELAGLRALGGDVMVSFGGAANTSLAVACPDADALAAEYARVIEALDLTRVDFDIEGAALQDPASIDRRSVAVAALQVQAAAAGRPLHVWYTLPVLPTGLTADGVAVLESAAVHGVELAGVNVMTMDYGAGAAPEPAGKMGEYGIDAIRAVHVQLGQVWPALDAVERWSMVGTTPMIGQNDVAGEFFDLEDAEQTLTFAQTNGVGMIGWWSVNRDHPCAVESESAQSDCNGTTDVGDWAYAQVFAGYR